MPSPVSIVKSPATCGPLRPGSASARRFGRVGAARRLGTATLIATPGRMRAMAGEAVEGSRMIIGQFTIYYYWGWLSHYYPITIGFTTLLWFIIIPFIYYGVYHIVPLLLGMTMIDYCREWTMNIVLSLIWLKGHGHTPKLLRYSRKSVMNHICTIILEGDNQSGKLPESIIQGALLAVSKTSSIRVPCSETFASRIGESDV